MRAAVAVGAARLGPSPSWLCVCLFVRPCVRPCVRARASASVRACVCGVQVAGRTCGRAHVRRGGGRGAWGGGGGRGRRPGRGGGREAAGTDAPWAAIPPVLPPRGPALGGGRFRARPPATARARPTPACAPSVTPTHPVQRACLASCPGPACRALLPPRPAALVAALHPGLLPGAAARGAALAARPGRLGI